MLAQIASLLLGTAANLLTIAFLGRLYAQWARAPFRNPVGQFIVTLTDWAIRPLRRFIPGLFGIDLSSLFAAWLVQIAYFGIMAGLTGTVVTVSPETMLGVAWIAAVGVLRMLVYLLMGVVIIAALLSWINPYSPLAPFFDLLARPLLGPVRRRMPALGGVDLSPLVVLLLLEVALIVLANLLPARLFLP